MNTLKHILEDCEKAKVWMEELPGGKFNRCELLLNLEGMRSLSKVFKRMDKGLTLRHR